VPIPLEEAIVESLCNPQRLPARTREAIMDLIGWRKAGQQTVPLPVGSEKPGGEAPILPQEPESPAVLGRE